MISKKSSIFRRIVVCLVVILTVSMLTACTNSYNNTVPPTTTPLPTEPPLIDEPLLFLEVEYRTPITYTEAISDIGIIYTYLEVLNAAIISENYTTEAIVAMREEVWRLESYAELYNTALNKFSRWENEYPVATTVWFYLRNAGYSEVVAAAIIGNMMIETSGGTLKLNPTIYDSSRGYYGLCQWSLYYCPQVADMDIFQQLNFLSDTIEKEFKNFGFCYRRGFTYEEFINMTSPEEAALAFAKVYERCASFSYGVRERAARVAYNYFTSEVQ